MYFFRYQLDVYPHANPIPREELCKRIKGVTGLFCMITEKVDKELLDCAGNYCVFELIKIL